MTYLDLFPRQRPIAKQNDPTVNNRRVVKGERNGIEQEIQASQQVTDGPASQYLSYWFSKLGPNKLKHPKCCEARASEVPADLNVVPNWSQERPSTYFSDVLRKFRG